MLVYLAFLRLSMVAILLQSLYNAGMAQTGAESGQAAREIGDRIRRLRLSKNLSMRQLAKDAGVTVSYVSELESGRVSPTIATLRKVLVAFGLDLGSFFAEEGNRIESYVFPREEMHSVEDQTRKYVFLLPRRRDLQMEFVEESYLPGESPEYETISSDLAGYITQGELMLEIEGEPPQHVRKGDAFYVKAGQPVRGWSANKRRPVQLITVYTPPRY